QRFRITFGIDFDHDESTVRQILVFVDGRAHFAQRSPQFDFLFTLDRISSQRYREPHQYRDDHYGHDEFDQGESTNTITFHGAETVTSVPLPTETFCWASRIRKSVIRKVESPARVPRSSTSVTRLPVPASGAEPGGRSRDIRIMPFSVSSLCTNATICPSRL